MWNWKGKKKIDQEMPEEKCGILKIHKKILSSEWLVCNDNEFEKRGVRYNRYKDLKQLWYKCRWVT